ncbi:hypothetical protein [Ornithinimicrobium sp. INDO-MA30-4]|uniref:hypothetical protein n=1 Tax=Ornithinimicrobium sp. INDO-MA30-4 TaxID=2908651 RepID=UPI001F43A456|nr:hypothetical protein [Ornithinimicrobium sp. INDO-MA30-4]UJH70211.1 hypothetical protein L0A91_13700 [Ornithinimicrobium sp. INDO-MA30-4]
MAPTLVALSAIVLGEGQGTQPAYADDTIETHWIRVAATGAFLDLVIAMGLGLAITSILDLADIPLIVFWCWPWSTQAFATGDCYAKAVSDAAAQSTQSAARG